MAGGKEALLKENGAVGRLATFEKMANLIFLNGKICFRSITNL